MMATLHQLLGFIGFFAIVTAFYAALYGVRRLQGKAKPGDWKPRAVPMRPGDFDDDDSSSDSGGSSSASGTSGGGGSFGGGGASGSW